MSEILSLNRYSQCEKRIENINAWRTEIRDINLIEKNIEEVRSNLNEHAAKLGTWDTKFLKLYKSFVAIFLFGEYHWRMVKSQLIEKNFIHITNL